MAKKKSEAVAEEIVADEAVIEEAAPAEEKAPEPLMYVGPAGAQEAFGKLPELRNLFLEIEQYPMAEKMLRDQKGFVFSAFSKALTLKGGNES